LYATIDIAGVPEFSVHFYIIKYTELYSTDRTVLVKLKLQNQSIDRLLGPEIDMVLVPYIVELFLVDYHIIGQVLHSIVERDH